MEPQTAVIWATVVGALLGAGLCGGLALLAVATIGG